MSPGLCIVLSSVGSDPVTTLVFVTSQGSAYELLSKRAQISFTVTQEFSTPEGRVSVSEATPSTIRALLLQTIGSNPEELTRWRKQIGAYITGDDELKVIDEVLLPYIAQDIVLSSQNIFERAYSYEQVIASYEDSDAVPKLTTKEKELLQFLLESVQERITINDLFRMFGLDSSNSPAMYSARGWLRRHASRLAAKFDKQANLPLIILFDNDEIRIIENDQFVFPAEEAGAEGGEFENSGQQRGAVFYNGIPINRIVELINEGVSPAQHAVLVVCLNYFRNQEGWHSVDEIMSLISSMNRTTFVATVSRLAKVFSSDNNFPIVVSTDSGVGRRLLIRIDENPVFQKPMFLQRRALIRTNKALNLEDFTSSFPEAYRPLAAKVFNVLISFDPYKFPMGLSVDEICSLIRDRYGDNPSSHSVTAILGSDIEIICRHMGSLSLHKYPDSAQWGVHPRYGLVERSSGPISHSPKQEVVDGGHSWSGLTQEEFLELCFPNSTSDFIVKVMRVLLSSDPGVSIPLEKIESGIEWHSDPHKLKHDVKRALENISSYYQENSGMPLVVVLTDNYDVQVKENQNFILPNIVSLSVANEQQKKAWKSAYKSSAIDAVVRVLFLIDPTSNPCGLSFKEVVERVENNAGIVLNSAQFSTILTRLESRLKKSGLSVNRWTGSHKLNMRYGLIPMERD